MVSELRADIEAAYAEYHGVTKKIGEASAELARLSAAVAEMSNRSKEQEAYLVALGKLLEGVLNYC